MDLQGLQERLLESAKPTRDLAIYVMVAFGMAPSDANTLVCTSDDPVHFVDAAVALADRLLPGWYLEHVGKLETGWNCVLRFPLNDIHSDQDGSTMALAIVRAVVDALVICERFGGGDALGARLRAAKGGGEFGPLELWSLRSVTSDEMALRLRLYAMVDPKEARQRLVDRYPPHGSAASDIAGRMAVLTARGLSSDEALASVVEALASEIVATPSSNEA